MLRYFMVLLVTQTILHSVQRKDWAFYGYFVGDEEKNASLETSQVRDMIELKDGMRYDNTHVVVQHDRGTKLNATLKSFYRD